MTQIDYLIAAIVIISMLFGAIRGFLRESIALLGWLTGLWLAWRYSGMLEPYLGGAIAGTELQTWLARIIVLLAVVVAAWLIGALLGFLVQRSGLTLGIDRILGALFGAVRGAVIVGFVVMLAQAADMRNEPWWKASKVIPVGEEMASILRGYVETGKQLVDELPAAGT
jgi:membrane protein required for colicin V production